MPQNANQIAPISKKRNWWGIVFSSVLGGTVAVVAAPTVAAALLPWGILGFFAGTTATGVLGSVVTKIAGNASNAGQVILTIHQCPIQQFYRKTVNIYIGTVLESVLRCLQTNDKFQYHNLVKFDIEDGFLFQGLDAKEKHQMFFDLAFRVVPKSGTEPRKLGEGVAPPNLPAHAHNATRTVSTGDQMGLLAGVRDAAFEGAKFGIVGGAVATLVPGGALAGAKIVETVKGKVNVIVGMSSATGVAGPIKNLAFPSEELDKATLFVEFATEVQHHVNRLVQCATSNSVGLEIDMKIGSASKMEGTLSSPSHIAGIQNHTCYWETNARV
jgi:hypothetical protein